MRVSLSFCLRHFLVMGERTQVNNITTFTDLLESKKKMILMVLK